MKMGRSGVEPVTSVWVHESHYISELEQLRKHHLSVLPFCKFYYAFRVFSVNVSWFSYYL